MPDRSLHDDAQPARPVDRLRDVWRRRKWLTVTAALLPLAVAGGLVWFSPNLYQATATVSIERRIPEHLVKATVATELETRLHVITREVLDRGRLEALIDKHGLYPHARARVPMHELAQRMRRDVKVESQWVERRGRGDLATVSFTVSYRGSDPAAAAAVANDLAALFVEANVKTRETLASTTADFLKMQLEDTKARLDDQERRVTDFKKRYPGGMPQQSDLNLVMLERLRSDLRANAVNQVRAAERRDALLEQLRQAEAAAPAAELDPTAARLLRLRQELTELRTRYTDRYPDVVRLRMEVAELERQQAESTGRERPAVEPRGSAAAQARQRGVSQAEQELAMLRDEERQLRAAIGTYERRVAEAPRTEQEYRKLSRDYDSTRELYAVLLARYEEAQIGESVEQQQGLERFRLVERAGVPDEPVAPNRLRLTIFAVALSLGLGAAATVLAEHLDTSFHSVDDLRGFAAVPVAAVIPRIVREDDVGRRRRRWRLGAAGVLAALVAVVAVSYLVAHGNHELVALLARGRF
jgi:polysaccharide biosynthesis transport protein